MINGFALRDPSRIEVPEATNSPYTAPASAVSEFYSACESNHPNIIATDY